MVVSWVSSIYRTIYVDWDTTVYLYASRRNASTWDFRISI